jgi:hypothetical protein
MDAGLRLELLGGLRVSRGDAPVSGFVSHKARALLVYLAVTGRPQPREALAGLLWGDWPQAEARANLRARADRADLGDGRGQPAVGRRAHPRGTVQGGYPPA